MDFLTELAEKELKCEDEKTAIEFAELLLDEFHSNLKTDSDKWCQVNTDKMIESVYIRVFKNCISTVSPKGMKKIWMSRTYHGTVPRSGAPPSGVIMRMK